MLAPKIAPRARRRGATLFEMAIVVALLGALAILHFEREQAAVRQQIVGTMAAELQRVLDAAMAYQLDTGKWPLDSCSEASYAAGTLLDCNGDGNRQSNDINGVRRLVDSGYLHAGGIAINSTRNLAVSRTLMGASLVMQPVQEIVPAASTDLGSGQSVYHTTAYWQSYLPGTASASNSSPTVASGLRVRYALPRSAGWSCHARELAHHVIGAKAVRIEDPLPTPPPGLTGTSQDPQQPISLDDCRQRVNAVGDSDEVFAVEVLLRRWQESTATVDIPLAGTLHLSMLRLGGASGVPVWLDSKLSGELRLRAAVRSPSDLATTDAMIQFAKADTHPTAPLGGIVTLRGVEEGSLGIMSGYVPGGADAVRPTFIDFRALLPSHQHLASLVFERPDGSHIGMLSADLMQYNPSYLASNSARFGAVAVTLSAGDAARASRHAGWRADIEDYVAGTQGIVPAQSLLQADSTGLRLYNVVRFSVAGVRIYGGRMTIMPGSDFYAGFRSSDQRYFTMSSADNPPASISGVPEAFEHPGEGIQVNRLAVRLSMEYDPPDTSLLSAGVVRPAGLGGSAKRVPLVGAGASHSNYPDNFILSPATGLLLWGRAYDITLTLLEDLELHEFSITNLSGLTLQSLDFAVTSSDAPFDSAATVQALDGGIQNLHDLDCAIGAAQCPSF